MEFHLERTTLLLILMLFITSSSSSSSSSSESSSSSSSATTENPLAFIFDQKQLEPFLTNLFKPVVATAAGDKKGAQEKLKVNESSKVGQEVDEQTMTKGTTDLIQKFLTSTIEKLAQTFDGQHETVVKGTLLILKNNTNTTDAHAKKEDEPHSRAARDVDIRLDQSRDNTSPSRASAFGRAVQAVPDTIRSGDVMSVPRDLLEQSFNAARDGLLTRQRSIENMWMSSGGGSDPRSPIGTAYAFSAPNQIALAMSNNSALLEIASRAFMRSLSPEAQRAVRHKRQIQNSFPTGMDPRMMMPENMMHVNVKPFVTGPDMSMGCGKQEPEACDRATPFRTLSGVCNNLRNPSWGRAVLIFDRMLPPVYSDGISVPRMHSVTGPPLPSPRYVSSTVHIDVSHLSRKHTLLLMQYGQFLDHDITFTPVHRGPQGILNCRSCNSPKEVHPECWPIQVPFGDTYYPDREASTGKSYCIPFTRSLPGQQRLGPREQINQNSAYIDGSQIYGENICKSVGLRSPGGYLNSTFQPKGKLLMPQTNDIRECKSQSGFCFSAGDSRASEQPALAAVHTLFLREHNRLVDGLRTINPHWNEEKLYHHARRIVIAENQHIVFNEWLPRIIGPSMMSSYDLQLEQSFYYTRYDQSCEAQIYNEFATAAFRFGHSLIRPQLPRMNDQYHGMSPTIQLRDGFFNSDMLMKPLMIDEIIRGLIAEPMEQLDPFVTNELTNHLFEDKNKAFSGMDLISLNIHRGRDHGLEGYNAYRAACNLPRAHGFEELSNEIPTDVIDRLRLVYAHVDDIDLFTGALVERPVKGGIVGPTIACILGSQFRRLRQCDRFWYETNDPVVQFTPQQLAELRKTTLAKVTCDNLDIPADIQKNAFDAPHNVLNPRIPCERLPTIDLNAWRDPVPGFNAPFPPLPASYVSGPITTCSIGSTTVPAGGSGMASPCVSCICTNEGTKCASLRIVDCGQLVRENTLANILADNVCTTQCGHMLSQGPVVIKRPYSRFRANFKNVIDDIKANKPAY